MQVWKTANACVDCCSLCRNLFHLWKQKRKVLPLTRWVQDWSTQLCALKKLWNWTSVMDLASIYPNGNCIYLNMSNKSSGSCLLTICCCFFWINDGLSFFTRARHIPHRGRHCNCSNCGTPILDLLTCLSFLAGVFCQALLFQPQVTYSFRQIQYFDPDGQSSTYCQESICLGMRKGFSRQTAILVAGLCFCDTIFVKCLQGMLHMKRYSGISCQIMSSRLQSATSCRSSRSEPASGSTRFSVW